MSKGRRSRNVFIILALALGIIGGYFILQSFQGGYNPFDPSANPPPGVSQPSGSATVYQALYLQYADGADRWVYAPNRMTSLAIIDPAHGVELSNKVTKIQTHVYMNVNFERSVASWSFTADGNFKITDASLNPVKDFGLMPISVTGHSLSPNVDTWVTSASMTASDVEALYTFSHYPTKYAVTITVSNIKITLNHDDGTQTAINVMSGSENTLVWRFYIYSSSAPR